MSAFIVGKKHIAYMVNTGLHFTSSRVHWYALAKGVALRQIPFEDLESVRRELRSDNASEVGSMLWAENVKSVNARYRRQDHQEDFVYEHDVYDQMRHKFDPVQALKAIKCYEYQSCEHSDWEMSEAHDFCRALFAHLVPSLKGYEAAQWEIK